MMRNILNYKFFFRCMNKGLHIEGLIRGGRVEGVEGWQQWALWREVGKAKDTTLHFHSFNHDSRPK